MGRPIQFLVRAENRQVFRGTFVGGPVCCTWQPGARPIDPWRVVCGANRGPRLCVDRPMGKPGRSALGVWLRTAWLLCMAVGVAVAAETHIDFDRLSIDEGLSQSIVEQMVQDRQGFMWFVTEDGLNRFDGYTFTVYRNVAGDPSSLSHNELKSICEDKSGILWVGAFEAGLNRFDPITEKVTRYRHDPSDPGSLATDTVLYITEDRAGRLWVGTQGGGLDLLDRTTGKFRHHRANPGTPGALSHDDVRAIYGDGDGVVWVGTNGGGLNRLDPATGSFTYYRHRPDDPSSLTHDDVRAIYEDRSGVLWVGTYGGGLDSFDRSTGRFTHHRANPSVSGSLSSDLVRAICEDHAGTLWVGTDGGGLNRFDRESGTFASFRNDRVNPTSLSADRVYSLFQDRSQVLWVGTYGGGLSKFDVGRKKFRRYANEPNNPDSLSHDIVWCFAEDPDGVLWIGTDSGGLNRLDRRSGRWQSFRHRAGDQSTLGHDTVRGLLEDRDGVLWVATNGGGLDRLDRRTHRFTHYRHDPSDPGSVAHDELRSIYQDRAGAIWVGTFGGGLDLLDPRTGRFTHHRHDPGDPSSISNDFIRLMVEDRTGALWVGTQGGGVNRLDTQRWVFKNFRNDPDDPSSLSNDHVFAIHEARDGTLWFGTFGGGLNRLDQATGRFRRYTARDGLASDSVYAMLEDGSGRLWISTTRGLSRFDPRTGEFRNYDVRDGLQSNEFNGGSAYLSASGEMFFGGINGFNAFFPDEIGFNPVVPEVVITDLRLFNRSVRAGERSHGRVILQRPVNRTDAIELSYEDNLFSLEFAALHYSAPGKNRYAYTMEGFSDAWIPVNADRRFAAFTGLAPGKYVFRVRGANSDGVWNERGAAVRITITPPFWGTWWFRLSAGLLALAIGGAVLRARVHSVRMRTELKAARDAQMAIMPQVEPEVEGFEVCGLCIPAHEVGGDFFDYFWLEGEKRQLCIIVGDVAGKAMRAAMTALMSDGMIFSRARQGGDLEEIMRSLNRSIHQKIGRRMFTALCVMVLDPETGEVAFANAGLCEPLMRSGAGVEYLSSPGATLPLGARPDTSYERRIVRLVEGDVIVVFSDGVPEACNHSRGQYGYDRPRDLLARLDVSALSAESIRDTLIQDARRFSGGSHPSDDMTLVVIKATPTAARSDPR
jgi:ligand-binding sensor domain-containing protein